jgi:tetrahydromethanopterin S-methyltransferase subunit B
MEPSSEQIDKLEQLLESLIIMLGRSNKKLEDLSGRISQLEQYILESTPRDIRIKQIL